MRDSSPSFRGPFACTTTYSRPTVLHTYKEDGVRLVNCDGFDFWDNTVIDNGYYGLMVNNSDDGIVEENYGHDNASYDAYQTSSSTGNTWISNSWGSTYPSGLQ